MLDSVSSAKKQVPLLYSNKELASLLAKHGWWIFPCHETDSKSHKVKTPYISNGFLDASQDLDRIANWWKRWPNALIGFPPGPNGLLVIDQDVKKGACGIEAYRSITQAWRTAVRTRTPSGGLHDWHLAPVRTIGNGRGNLPKGIDIRCDNGYVCLGTLADGTCYAPVGTTDLYDLLLDPDMELTATFTPVPKEVARELHTVAVSKSKYRDLSTIDYAEGYAPVTLERLRAVSVSIAEWTPPEGADRSNSDDAWDWLTKAIAGICQAREGDASTFGDDEARNLRDLVCDADQDFMAHYDERGEGKLGYDIDRAIDWARCAGLSFDPQRKRSATAWARCAERPEVRLASGYHDAIVIEAEDYLARCCPALYDRGGVLVRPVFDQMKSCRGDVIPCPAFRAVTPDYMRLRVASHVNFIKYLKTDDKWVRTDPPREVTNAMLSRSGEWPYPQLAGLSTAPTLRADGSVLSAPGYDPATGIYLFGGMSLELPEHPTWDDAQNAGDLLDELLEEFPFVDAASYSVGMSSLITPIVRSTMDVAPFHLATAPAAGSGKSYLFDLASMIALGTPCPVMSTGRSEEELEKRLGAKVLAGHPIINIDNAEIDLGGDALCQLVERPIVDLRILGKSEMPRAINRQVIFGSGNNIPLKGDMVRRSIIATMDARLERPHEKRFKRDPMAMIKAHRGRYVAACITFVRAYMLAGSPRVTSTPMNSFAGWSETVRSALLWNGYADPCETMEAARENDPERQQLLEFLGAFADEVGTGRWNGATLRELVTNAEHLAFPKLKAALQPFARGGEINTLSLGKWLAKRKKCIINGVSLDTYTGHRRNTKWFLLEHRG